MAPTLTMVLAIAAAILGVRWVDPRSGLNPTYSAMAISKNPILIPIIEAVLITLITIYF